MCIKTHLDNTLYLSSLWSDLSCAADLVIAGAPAGCKPFLLTIKFKYYFKSLKVFMTHLKSAKRLKVCHKDI